MSDKRVFIAINLPKDVKSDLAKIVDRIRPKTEGAFRFMKPENWHITLSFLGNQSDHDISLIADALQETVESWDAPEISFENIVYGPIKSSPRMIWLIGSKETSKALGELRGNLEKRLFESGVRFAQEHRAFAAHITLARLRPEVSEEFPELDEKFSGQFIPESVELMDSELKNAGADYSPLAKVAFGGQNS